MAERVLCRIISQYFSLLIKWDEYSKLLFIIRIGRYFFRLRMRRREAFSAIGWENLRQKECKFYSPLFIINLEKERIIFK